MKNKLKALVLGISIFTSFIGSGWNPVLASEVENQLILSDDEILLNKEEVTNDKSKSVYLGEDIVYYEEGHDSEYGEGTAHESHSEEEAKAHTVVTIREAGVYRLSGYLSKGQIAIDLGEDAKTDENAKVTLILDGLSVENTVAPAIIFYNVYESNIDSLDNPSAIVDTKNAGANIIIADDSINTVSGSHVAKIFKEGTSKKLHKYDGAFYSKMSMNIDGESKDSGRLNIIADNEGLGTELHLTINGGQIFISSQDDGINTNEDDISVTTINGGYLNITGGLGAEGDGIDSNGYLVINAGSLVATANEKAGDGGIDADKGIFINGGNVIATGSRNDSVDKESKQKYMELSFNENVKLNELLYMTDSESNLIFSYENTRAYSSFTFSSEELEENVNYNIYKGGQVSTSDGTSSITTAGELLEYKSKGNQNRPGNPPNMAFENIGEGQPPMKTDGEGDKERPSFDPNQERPEKPEGDFRPDRNRPSDTNSSLVGQLNFILNDEGYSFSSLGLRQNSDNDNSLGNNTDDNNTENSNLPFKDLSSNSPSYQAIAYLYHNNYISGTSTTTFDAEKEVSLGMLLTSLGKLEKIQVTKSESNEHWAYSYALWAKEKNLIDDFTSEDLNKFLSKNEIFEISSKLLDTSHIDSSIYINNLNRAEFAQILFDLLNP